MTDETKQTKPGQRIKDADELDAFIVKAALLVPKLFSARMVQRIRAAVYDTRYSCECWYNPETGCREYCEEHMPHPEAVPVSQTCRTCGGSGVYGQADEGTLAECPDCDGIVSQPGALAEAVLTVTQEKIAGLEAVQKCEMCGGTDITDGTILCREHSNERYRNWENNRLSLQQRAEIAEKGKAEALALTAQTLENAKAQGLALVVTSADAYEFRNVLAGAIEAEFHAAVEELLVTAEAFMARVLLGKRDYGPERTKLRAAVAAVRKELSKSTVPQPSQPSADDMAKLVHCLTFFASVIKCGEPWTDICQREYDEACALWRKK